MGSTDPAAFVGGEPEPGPGLVRLRERVQNAPADVQRRGGPRRDLDDFLVDEGEIVEAQGKRRRAPHLPYLVHGADAAGQEDGGRERARARVLPAVLCPALVHVAVIRGRGAGGQRHEVARGGRQPVYFIRAEIEQ